MININWNSSATLRLPETSITLVLSSILILHSLSILSYTVSCLSRHIAYYSPLQRGEEGFLYQESADGRVIAY